MNKTEKIAKKIRIRLQDKVDRSYSVVIGSDILDKAGSAIRGLNKGSDIFLITDTKVGKLYARRVIRSLRSAGYNAVGQARVADDETSKSFAIYRETVEKLYRFDKYQNKKIIIVTLGGGVVGDLGGFMAGTYKRGVSYVQIPTTLLGQVDCGLGGKTGINLKEAKNLLGVFWQPKLVYMDMGVLNTLDAREIRSGLAEVIKYGIIKDAALFEYIEEHLEQILGCDPACLKHIIYTCVKIKAKITQQDERDEKDIRIILNFGHTIGHAVESASKYRVYTHGEAIAIGMSTAGEIASHLGLFSSKELLRLDNLLAQAGLPKKIKSCFLEDIMVSLRHDKKFISGKNRFVLPVAIGKVRVVDNIKESLIKDIIKKRMVR